MAGASRKVNSGGSVHCSPATRACRPFPGRSPLVRRLELVVDHTACRPLAAGELHDALSRQGPHGVQGGLIKAAHVRGEHDVRELEERVIGTRWLDYQHVEP